MTAIGIAPSLSDWFADAWPTMHAVASAPIAQDDALSDEQLMRRYRGGNANAFGQLYRRYSDRLHRFILRMAMSRDDADEIFQEVWIAVIRAKERYTPQAKFVTYLFAIAHRRAIDRLRSQSRMEEDVDSSHVLDGDAIADTAQPEAADIVWRADAGQALLDAIAALPLLQREAFLLHAEGELSVEDIAQATGTNRETAKSRLRYANKRLRAALEAWR
jgi:RNA polymerase sigma-70 factor (ECF subfamily)